MNYKTLKKKKQIWLFLHFQISISFINHQCPEHREVHLTTLKRWMYRIYKFRIYPRLTPCLWRNQSEPCPCCVGAPTATVCCPGEKLRTAPVKRLESGCCWTESFLEVHQQGWVLQRRQRGWCSECSNWSKKKNKIATSVYQYSPIHVLEVRGREVGEDSGSVIESVIVRIAWECLLSPFSFTSSSTCEAPLKVHGYKGRF